MKIQVAVAACQRCHETEKNVCVACSQLNLVIDILHVYDMKEFAELGVFFTPAEIMDGKIDCFSSAAS